MRMCGVFLKNPWPGSATGGGIARLGPADVYPGRSVDRKVSFNAGIRTPLDTNPIDRTIEALKERPLPSTESKPAYGHSKLIL